MQFNFINEILIKFKIQKKIIKSPKYIRDAKSLIFGRKTCTNRLKLKRGKYEITSDLVWIEIENVEQKQKEQQQQQEQQTRSDQTSNKHNEKAPNGEN